MKKDHIELRRNWIISIVCAIALFGLTGWWFALLAAGIAIGGFLINEYQL